MTDEKDAQSAVISPRRAHVCILPTVERTFTPPRWGADEPDPEPTVYADIPDLWSVWRCGCGQCWRVEPPQQYANLVICVNRWQRISGRKYRRAVARYKADS